MASKTTPPPNRLMRAISAGCRVVQLIVVFTTWLARCCMCEENQKRINKKDKKKDKKDKASSERQKEFNSEPGMGPGKKGVEPVLI